MSRRTQLVVVYILSFLPHLIYASPTSSCYGNSTTLDWYIDAVGETPCMTYQRLRQICNSEYETPSWAIDAPTDQCDDSLSTCCCNSIAWSLRMLCINCEWDKLGTSDGGHSAGPYAYYNYRWSTGAANSGTYCGDGWNQTLPENLQQAICDKEIPLSDFLYSIFWPDGSWNFPTFEQLAEQVLTSHNNQSLNSCNNSTRITNYSTSTDSVTIAAIGGSLGGALGLVLFGVIGATIYIKKRRIRRSQSVITRSVAYAGANRGPSPSGTFTPFLGRRRELSEQSSQRTPSLSAHSEDGLLPSGSYTSPATGDDEAEVSAAPIFRATPQKGKGRTKRWRRKVAAASPLPDPEEHEQDAGALMQGSPLPPDYRTVYTA